MTEQTPENAAEQPNETSEGAEQAPPWGDDFDPARAWHTIQSLREREKELASQNKAATAELEKQRQASMTEAEKAVADAEARGRTAAATEFGKRLARTEFDALAGRRNADFDTSSALEFVDLSRFLDESGEPDMDAIKSAVERLVPPSTAATPSYDGGVRSTSSSTDFNQVLRQAAGRA